MEIIVRVLQKERDNTRRIVEEICEYEKNYLFTNDQTYKEQRADIVPQQRGPASQGGPNGMGGPNGGPGGNNNFDQDNSMNMNNGGNMNNG